MNQNEVTDTSGGAAHYRWWAAASTGQLVWGIYALRRGYAGECRMMPLKAFAVASLFVGATASASMASIRAYGIHSVEDLKVVGASIRTGLGLTQMTQQQQQQQQLQLQPSVIPQVGSGEDRVYADITPTT
ncbi:hypothetical protein RND71_001317 [Anisodus tanguticus]|uniref:Uncharacterized protein n=1 Tax=Anisodus tanguticus TaxID=243964 RepID=A0AAE1T006_9SOLA|nr:hypothetical protein RND71_001317 [Anisodus tanguticus]